MNRSSDRESHTRTSVPEPYSLYRVGGAPSTKSNVELRKVLLRITDSMKVRVRIADPASMKFLGL